MPVYTIPGRWRKLVSRANKRFPLLIQGNEIRKLLFEKSGYTMKRISAPVMINCKSSSGDDILFSSVQKKRIILKS